jgi:hypothetical protein
LTHSNGYGGNPDGETAPAAEREDWATRSILDRGIVSMTWRHAFETTLEASFRRVHHALVAEHRQLPAPSVS